MFDFNAIKFEPKLSLNFGRRKNPREIILGKLYQEYLLSNDGISPALAAGLELPPKEWLNKRLEELGKNWRV